MTPPSPQDWFWNFTILLWSAVGVVVLFLLIAGAVAMAVDIAQARKQRKKDAEEQRRLPPN
ncbi:MAG TPA: hypothetical protein VEL77_15225 [Rugosimonospora sp.]|nr:hypothetical protein [Rugosimonospora sp.]